MPDQITRLLDDIERLDREATPGLWESEGSDEPVIYHHQRSQKDGSYVGSEGIATVFSGFANARFIAASREVMPALAQAVKGVLDVLDAHPAPGKGADPTGYATTRLELLEHQIREAITEVLGGDDDQ